MELWYDPKEVNVALPVIVETVQVTGTYLTPKGDPVKGAVQFIPTLRLEVPGEAIILPVSQSVPLDENGHFSVNLASTENPDLEPGLWLWRVVERVPGGFTWSFELPLSPASVDITELDSVLPTPPPPSTPGAPSVDLGPITTRIDQVETRLDVVEATDVTIIEETTDAFASANARFADIEKKILPVADEAKEGDILEISKIGSDQSFGWSGDLRHLIEHLGDVTSVGIDGGLEVILNGLSDRVEALELASGGVNQPHLVSEGFLYVDMYATSFERVRDVDGILTNGENHVVAMKLATTSGPGGAVIADVNSMPTGTTGVWYDVNGSLGNVKTATGGNVTATAIKDWCKYGGNSASGTISTLLIVKQDLTTDSAHPALIVLQKVNVSAP
jgi:hypothetical protein